MRNDVPVGKRPVIETNGDAGGLAGSQFDAAESFQSAGRLGRVGGGRQAEIKLGHFRAGSGAGVAEGEFDRDASVRGAPR